MSKKRRNPQHTKDWKFLNDAPYRSKLSPEEKQFLDEFNSSYWNDRPRDDAMNIANPLGEYSVHWTASPKLPSSKDRFSSVTPEDIRRYFIMKRDKIGYRELARRTGAIYETTRNKMMRVEEMLSELSPEDVATYLPEDITEDQLKEALVNLQR